MNISNVSIYLNGEWKDISNNVNTKNNITIQGRCDSAFAIGSFSAWLDIWYNIPPYTLLRINDKEYVCSSSNSRYLTEENVYVHEFDILELTSLLSCWIVGSKNFSISGTNKRDSEKINILFELMNYKYGINFDCDVSSFNQEQEFTLPPGATLFDCLTEIFTTYNRKPIITSFEPETSTCVVSWIDLTLASQYELEKSRILSIKCSQNVDNYCQILESEMSNIIDRNTPITVRGLTTRSDTIQMCEDTCKLILPTRVEKITKLVVDVDTYLTFAFCKIKISKYFNDYLQDDGTYDIPETLSLYDWIYSCHPNQDDITYSDSPIYRLFQEIRVAYNCYIDEEIPDVYLTFGGKYEIDGEGYCNLTWSASNTGLLVNNSVDVTGYCLEEEVYNCLETKEKTKYCYYKSGENYIDALNKRYKDDIWNSLLGNTEFGFIYHVVEAINKNLTIYDPAGTEIYCVALQKGSSNYNPAKLQYSVTYIPIVDMFVSDKKTCIPSNEVEYKKISRSYDKNSNFIDFGRMINSIRRINDSLGLEELSIEYLTVDINPPSPAQAILYQGITWYVASYVRSIGLKNDITMINLVRDYNKVADAIGVKTQYSSTKNPLNNVIDRHLFVEVDEELAIPINNLYMSITYNSITLYKRATILTEAGQTYITFETMDSYCFDKTCSKVNSSYYAVEDVPYCDENNELGYCTITLWVIEGLSLEESLKLPYIDWDSFTGYSQLITAITSVPVYKDARERLFFTLKFNNVSFKEFANEYKIIFTAGAGVEFYELERISSPTGFIGVISLDDNVYEGDVIKVSYTLKEGYQISGAFQSMYRVGKENLEINIYTSKITEV